MAWHSCAHHGVRAWNTGGTGRFLKGAGPSPGSAVHTAFLSSAHSLRLPLAHVTPSQSQGEELPGCMPRVQKMPTCHRMCDWHQ